MLGKSEIPIIFSEGEPLLNKLFFYISNLFKLFCALNLRVNQFEVLEAPIESSCWIRISPLGNRLLKASE